MGLHRGGSGGHGGGGGSDDGGIRGEEIVEHEVDVDVEVAAGRRDVAAVAVGPHTATPSVV